MTMKFILAFFFLWSLVGIALIAIPAGIIYLLELFFQKIINLILGNKNEAPC